MNNINFGFFGSDKFSNWVLDELKSQNLIPKIIFTLPDRIKGRGLELEPTETKKWALENKISIIEISTFDHEIIQQIEENKFDLCVLASFGKIIPNEVLEKCGKGMLNVHPSLLPKFRGASPIETAILNDEKSTGVSIMLVDDKMDHGPILESELCEFAEWPSKIQVEETLARLGGKKLAEIIPKFVNNEITPLAQDDTLATYTKKIQKTDGQIDWNMKPREIFLKIVAMNPWPGAFFFMEHKNKSIRIKITQAVWQEDQLKIEKVIPEGRAEMNFLDFCRGFDFKLPF